jgi:23S rRNA (guanosine2251-2'-O)-methyltransferase
VINLSQTLDKLKESGFWIYSSVLNEKSKNYQKIDYDSKSVLVIGSEENGVSKNLIDKSDFLIKIPMCGKTQSLNVSVACGILLSNIRK